LWDVGYISYIPYSLEINMLFKTSVIIVGLFAIFVLISAIYAHISYAIMKMDSERDIS
jgi:hypothetical protein